MNNCKCMLCKTQNATIKKEVLIPVPKMCGTFRSTGLFIEVCSQCYPNTIPVIIDEN